MDLRLVLVLLGVAEGLAWALPVLRETTATHARTDPITVMPWPGHVKIPGAILVSRVHLHRLYTACYQLQSQLETADSALQAIITSGLSGANKPQIQRVSYLTLNLEYKYDDIIMDVDSLSLCQPNAMMGIWGHYRKLKGTFDSMWVTIKEAKLWSRPQLLQPPVPPQP